MKFYSSRPDAEHCDEERQVVDWCMTYLLYQFQQTWLELVDNMPSASLRCFLRRVTFPCGARLKLPSDRLSQSVAGALMKPGAFRELMKSATPHVDHKHNIFTTIEHVFLRALDTLPIEKKLMKAVKSGAVGGMCFDQWMASALETGVLTSEEHDTLQAVVELKMQIINVDDFAPDEV